MKIKQDPIECRKKKPSSFNCQFCVVNINCQNSNAEMGVYLSMRVKRENRSSGLSTILSAPSPPLSVSEKSLDIRSQLTIARGHIENSHLFDVYTTFPMFAKAHTDSLASDATFTHTSA